MAQFIAFIVDCPGTQSNDAGKASACAGCPNQQLCASGDTKAPDPGIQLVQERLEQVQYKILILSGKGGVGKSTLTALLSRGLALNDSERNVSAFYNFLPTYSVISTSPFYSSTKKH